jgi:uncharacterized protein YbjT (DUF2867 family)
MTKVLVTGATGFVGKRLVLHLLEEGHEIYALCRVKGTKIFPEEKQNLHYIWGDLKKQDTFESIPSAVEAVYYLVHSMAEIVTDLASVELEIAEHFIKSLAHTRVQQIIYLGGIINDEKQISPHLQSRLLVETILKRSGIPVTVLRASIIIGSGSACFEIIRDLCEKLPIMIAPKWVSTSCQPIAIRDVIFYLTSVLLNKECYNQTFDIGGPEVLTFEEILLQYAKYRHLKRFIIKVPVLTPRLSSFWLVLITSVRFSLCYYLVESMKISSVQKLDAIKKILPHECITYAEALELAFQKISQNEIISTWMDAWNVKDINPSIEKYIEVPKEGCLRDVRRVLVKDTKEAAIQRIWCIGGETGYYSVDWAWKLRGLIDKIMGGVGLNRGRRHPTDLQVGDSMDFWRVLKADKKNGELILFSTMKVPGEAWLEFRLEKKEDSWFVAQMATFRPRGILGRLYWYVMYPFHLVIFQKMAKALAGY